MSEQKSVHGFEGKHGQTAETTQKQGDHGSHVVELSDSLFALREEVLARVKHEAAIELGRIQGFREGIEVAAMYFLFEAEASGFEEKRYYLTAVAQNLMLETADE